MLKETINGEEAGLNGAAIITKNIPTTSYGSGKLMLFKEEVAPGIWQDFFGNYNIQVFYPLSYRSFNHELLVSK